MEHLYRTGGDGSGSGAALRGGRGEGGGGPQKPCILKTTQNCAPAVSKPAGPSLDSPTHKDATTAGGSHSRWVEVSYVQPHFVFGKQFHYPLHGEKARIGREAAMCNRTIGLTRDRLRAGYTHTAHAVCAWGWGPGTMRSSHGATHRPIRNDGRRSHSRWVDPHVGYVQSHRRSDPRAGYTHTAHATCAWGWGPGSTQRSHGESHRPSPRSFNQGASGQCPQMIDSEARLHSKVPSEEP